MRKKNNTSVTNDTNSDNKVQELFIKTCNKLLQKYPDKAGEEEQIILHMYNEIYSDIVTSKSFIDLWKSRLTGTLYLGCEDFTKNQILKIIEESPLNERDRLLATLYWVDLETEDNIAYKLQIDRKTVRNNIPKVSLILKTTCMKIFNV